MNDPLQPAYLAYLLALADDQLILAHRNSEWIGHAPILEEDIALANIAQDELGHATLLYTHIAALTDDDPDTLAFFRTANAFRCAQLVEWPRGDWALTMLRQYLFDAAETERLARLVDSRDAPLAQIAAKMRKEELYHLRHTDAWVRRLALGTAESHQRTQAALSTLWPLAQQLFAPLPDEALLVDAGIVPPAAELHAAWDARVRALFAGCDLTPPAAPSPPPASRAVHSAHLPRLLAEMQAVARLDPEAEW